MENNNKGFTLIELIATILLLSIVVTISFVSINTVIKNSKVENCKSLVGSIESATKEYISDNRYNDGFIDAIDNYEITIDAIELTSNNYLKNDIIDPFTKEIINPEDVIIEIHFNSDYTVEKVTIISPEHLATCSSSNSPVAANNGNNQTTDIVVNNTDGDTTNKVVNDDDGGGGSSSSNKSSSAEPGQLTIPSEKPIRVYFNANGGQVSGKCRIGSKTSKACTNGKNDWASVAEGFAYQLITTDDDVWNYNNPSYMNITKEGYYAKKTEEWNTKSDGTGISLNQSQTYSLEYLKSIATEEKMYYQLNLYVKWIPKRITIIFNCNGGKQINGTTNTYTYIYGVNSQKFPNPAICERRGYEGDVWAWESSGSSTGNYSWTSNVINSWIDKYSTGNNAKTLYARWKEKPIPGATYYSGGLRIPYYYQGDYGDVRLRDDDSTKTIKSSGCGFTAVAMVVSYLKDEKISPRELIDDWSKPYYIYNSGMSGDFPEVAAAHYKLGSIEKTQDSKIAFDRLSKGHPVIIGLTANSAFNKGSHYILLRGITSEGKILVNDPGSKSNSEKEWNKTAITNSAVGYYYIWPE